MTITQATFLPLLAAIAANPEEDTPRLAYADWCDENDQPERAEFIRLQVRMATMQDCKHPPNIYLDGTCRYCEVNWRQRQLKYQIHNPLNYFDPDQVDYVRGFPDRVTCTAREWLTLADEILEVWPLTRVSLKTLPDTERSPSEEMFPAIWLAGRKMRIDARYHGGGIRDQESRPPFPTLIQIITLLNMEWPRITFTIPGVP